MTRASTTDRGYGTAHMKARTRYLAALRDGQLCHFCQQPMFRSQQLDLDHTPDRKGWKGLSHRACNRRAGAINGNRARGQKLAKIIRRTSVWD